MNMRRKGRQFKGIEFEESSFGISTKKTSV